MTNFKPTFANFLAKKTDSLPDSLTFEAFKSELTEADTALGQLQKETDDKAMGVGRMAFVFCLVQGLIAETAASNSLVEFEKFAPNFPKNEKTAVKAAVIAQFDNFQKFLQGSEKDADNVMIQALKFVSDCPSPRTIYSAQLADKKRKAAQTKADKGEAKAVVTGKTPAEKQVLTETDSKDLYDAAMVALRELANRARKGDTMAASYLVSAMKLIQAKPAETEAAKEAA